MKREIDVWIEEMDRTERRLAKLEEKLYHARLGLAEVRGEMNVLRHLLADRSVNTSEVA